MFEFRLSDQLKDKIKRLKKRDNKKVKIIFKKIKEIIDNDNDSIDRYKNLRYDLKNLKRVHVDKHFVLIFKVEKDNTLIRFIDFDHHDSIYKN